MDMVSIPKESLQRFVSDVRDALNDIVYYQREAKRADFKAGSDFGAVLHDLSWLEQRLVASLTGVASDESLCDVARRMPEFKARPR